MPYSTFKDSESFGHFFLDQILNWIAKWLKPENVFDDKALAGWARENGWTEKA